MKYFTLLLCSFFVACTHSPVGTPCQVETVATNAMASAVAMAMSCSNVSQIRADIQSSLGKADFCSVSNKPKGPIGNIVCPIAVQSVLTLVATKVPSSWGCSPTATVKNLGETLTLACQAVVPI